MKILFPYTGDTIGGSHWSSITLIQGLKNKKVSIDVILHEENKKLEGILINSGVDYKIFKLNYILKIYKRKYFFLFLMFELPKLIKYLKHNKIDIVHTNDNRIHTGWTIAAKLSRVKHVFHLRNSKLPPFSFWKLLKFFPSAYIYLSDFNGQCLFSFKCLKYKVPNPIKIPDVSEKKIKPEIVKLGFIGNMEPRKRFDIFVEICKRLNLQKPNQFQYNVFGSLNGLDVDRYENEVEHLKFYGFITDVDFVYSKIDILICPADKEPLGRTILEAMSKKIPVIASSNGGNPELLRDERGFLIKNGDPGLYCSTIFNVLENWERLESILDNANNFIKENFTLTKSTTQIVNIYKELLENN
jgi:glycosyltransferase involved in cell wall biosynthesis